MNFEEIYEESYEKVFKYVKSRVGNIEDAEDITQIVFTNLSQNMDKVDNAGGYLFSSAKNHCINYARDQKRKPDMQSLEELVFNDEENDVDDPIFAIEDERLKDVDNMERKEMIQKCLKDMSDKCKIVFILRLYTDWDWQEIADIAGLNVNTAKSRYEYAIQNMVKTKGESNV